MSDVNWLRNRLRAKAGTRAVLSNYQVYALMAMTEQELIDAYADRFIDVAEFLADRYVWLSRKYQLKKKRR